VERGAELVDLQDVARAAIEQLGLERATSAS
jgi:hypothetical protein